MQKGIRSSIGTAGIIISTVFSIIMAYYMTVLLHEYSHATMAWILGAKKNIFDIHYGGWFLANVDENVDYGALLSHGKGADAALIGISGVSYNAIVLCLCFFMMSRKTLCEYKRWHIFIYWTAIFNLMPIIGYIPADTFSTHGDIGLFVTGLNISPLWVFLLCTPLVIIAIIRIFHTEIVRLTNSLGINSLSSKAVYLLMSLVFLFLTLFSHGYNPLTDAHATYYSKIIASTMLFAVPILLVICWPSRSWVKLRCKKMKEIYQ